MRPPSTTKNDENTMSQSHVYNGTNNSQLGNLKGTELPQQRSDTWNEQRTRIDGLLSTLKKEMQEVKTMDKNLTRQFIHLGGKIQELKEVEKKLLEEISMEDNEDDNMIFDNNNGTSVTVLEDTKL